MAAWQEHVLGLEMQVGERDGRELTLKSALYMLGDLVEKWSLVDDDNEEEMSKTRQLLMCLREVDEFYGCIGGIIGYQIMVLELLSASSTGSKSNCFPYFYESLKSQVVNFHVPSGYNLIDDPEYASQAALWGIEELGLEDSEEEKLAPGSDQNPFEQHFEDHLPKKLPTGKQMKHLQIHQEMAIAYLVICLIQHLNIGSSHQ